VNNLPDKNTLDIMWSVATSSAIETDRRPHIIFAELLYNHLMNNQLHVGLYEDTSCQ
jgi:hypothetical protein